MEFSVSPRWEPSSLALPVLLGWWHPSLCSLWDCEGTGASPPPPVPGYQRLTEPCGHAVQQSVQSQWLLQHPIISQLHTGHHHISEEAVHAEQPAGQPVSDCAHFDWQRAAGNGCVQSSVGRTFQAWCTQSGRSPRSGLRSPPYGGTPSHGWASLGVRTLAETPVRLSAASLEQSALLQRAPGGERGAVMRKVSWCGHEVRSASRHFKWTFNPQVGKNRPPESGGGKKHTGNTFSSQNIPPFNRERFLHQGATLFPLV